MDPRLRASLARAMWCASPAQAVGMAPRRAVAAGQPIPPPTLSRPVSCAAARAGDHAVGQPGLSLTAQGIAMETAARGSASAC